MTTPTTMVYQSWGNGRLPRLQRAGAEERPPLRLTLRDVELIQAVWQYRALSSTQLAALYFGGTQGLRVCQRRLQRLYHHGYLTRVEQPVVPSDGSRPFLYLLDTAGAALLVTEIGIDPTELDWTAGHNLVGHPYLNHLLATNDVRIALHLAASRNHSTITAWLDDRALRSRQMKEYVTLEGAGGRSQRAAIVPDGYFKLTTPVDTYNFFLEADKATVTVSATTWGQRDWARKIRVYLAYYRAGGYARRYHTPDMRVLTVTTGARRLSNLKQITEKVAATQAPRFWFTTFTQITPETILTAPIWAVAGRQEPARLLPG